MQAIDRRGFDIRVSHNVIVHFIFDRFSRPHLGNTLFNQHILGRNHRGSEIRHLDSYPLLYRYLGYLGVRLLPRKFPLLRRGIVTAGHHVLLSTDQ